MQRRSQRLDIFIGTWELEAIFPNEPATVLRGGRSVFEWMKGHQLLIQRTTVPAPAAPDSLSVIAFDGDKHAYTQHYFDSRGVVRLYSMTLGDGVANTAQRIAGLFAAGFLAALPWCLPRQRHCHPRCLGKIH